MSEKLSDAELKEIYEVALKPYGIQEKVDFTGFCLAMKFIQSIKIDEEIND